MAPGGPTLCGTSAALATWLLIKENMREMGDGKATGRISLLVANAEVSFQRPRTTLHGRGQSGL